MLLWWWWLEKCRGLGIWRSPFGASPALPPTGKHISCVITRSFHGDRPVLRHWALAQMLGSVPMPTSLFQQARAKLTSFLSPKEQINLLPTSKISLPCFSFAWLEFFFYSGHSILCWWQVLWIFSPSPQLNFSPWDPSCPSEPKGAAHQRRPPGPKEISEKLHCAQSLGSIWLFMTLWTVACQATLSMGFSREEYWSGLPCPPPGDLSDPGIKPGLPHCRQILYLLSHRGSPWILEWVA